MSSRVDLDGVKIEGSVGSFVPVQTWPAHVLDFGDENFDRRRLICRAFVPSWARSWNAKVIVPLWPPTSKAHLIVNIDKGDKTFGKIIEQTHGPYFSLKLSEVSWKKVDPERGGNTRLAFGLTFQNPDINGFDRRELRFSDETGRSFDPGSTGTDGMSSTFDIDPRKTRPKRLRIDLYSNAEREASQVVFDFHRLPNQ